MFDDISPVYDRFNDVLSLGQHRVWKRRAVRRSRVGPGMAALDICCGSGDLARLLAHRVGPGGAVVGLDFAQNMLDAAEARPVRRPERRARVDWVLGDAMALPFEDCSFDAATMGYGLRNVDSADVALAELQRVLRPGAYCAILDFNNSRNPVVRRVRNGILERIVVPAARRRGLGPEYAYLRPSIESFETGPEQERLARAAGFESARHEALAGGLMGLLVCRKAG